jgi:hypothetical protein
VEELRAHAEASREHVKRSREQIQRARAAEERTRKTSGKPSPSDQAQREQDRQLESGEELPA